MAATSVAVASLWLAAGASAGIVSLAHDQQFDDYVFEYDDPGVELNQVTASYAATAERITISDQASVVLPDPTDPDAQADCSFGLQSAACTAPTQFCCGQVLSLGGGQDTAAISGRPASWILLGETGTDTLRAGQGADFLRGGAGGDTLRGGGGDDELSGDDPGAGQSGIDRLYGGPGDDLLISRGDDGAADTVDCGRGIDHVEAGAHDAIAANCEFATTP